MKLQNHKFYNCKVTLDDGTYYFLNADFLHNSKLDNWQGWQCDSGFNRIFINADNEVYGATCYNDYLGNLDAGWLLHQTPTTCKRSRCVNCTDDLMIGKVQPVETIR